MIKRNRKNFWSGALFFLCILFCSFSEAAQRDTDLALSPQKAFPLKIAVEAKKIKLHWHLPPHYFLYAKRLQIQFDPALNSKIILPAHKKIFLHGKMETVYTGDVNVNITYPVLPDAIKLSVKYQGCYENKFCYPEQTSIWHIENGVLVSETSLKNLISISHDQYKISNLLQAQNNFIALAIFFLLGLLLAFTPCVLPMIPILASIIVGDAESISKYRALFLAFSYVLGTAFTYAIAGIAAAYLGSSLQVWLQTPILIALTALIFLLLGLSLFDFFHLRLPKKFDLVLHRLHTQLTGGKYLAVFAMGMIASLVVSPCVSAPMLGVLIYIVERGDLWLGALSLFVFGLGIGTPLILIAVGTNNFLPRTGPWMNIIKKIFGLIMIILSVWLLMRVIPMPEFEAKPSVSKNNHQFQVVKSLEEFAVQKKSAQMAHEPILLDFYASWCTACVAMEENVLRTAHVTQALKHFRLLKFDLSANTANDEKIMQHFNVIAPPTYIIFDRNGKELVDARIAGEMSAHEFLSRLRKLSAE